MKYTVVWTPVAEQQLTALWLRVADRESVTQAAYAIDQQLRVNPESLGESRDRNRRVMFVSPLGIYFEVNVADRIVRVVAVWRYRQH